MRGLIIAGALGLAASLECGPAGASVTLLLAAGGGGGSAYADPYGPTQSGGEGLVSASGGGAPGFTGGAGGVGGLGGAGGTERVDFRGIPFGSNGGGGAGWLGDGGNGLNADSGHGGFGPPSFAGAGNGGFGGGGRGGGGSDVLFGGGGGGGGYSGGGGGSGASGGGGGGGSYVAPFMTQSNGQSGYNGSPVRGQAGQNGFVQIDSSIYPLPLEFGYTGSVVDYVVPVTGVYVIEALGAQGGSEKSFQPQIAPGPPGGYGALVLADVELKAGTQLEIVVGGGGGYGSWFCCGGGGGGGSFVWETGVVPEPSTWAMTLIGFMGLGWAAARRGVTARAVT